MVVVGHCTRKDWALAATLVRQIRKIGNQAGYGFLENMRPPQSSLARIDLLLLFSWDHRRWLTHLSITFRFAEHP